MVAHEVYAGEVELAAASGTRRCVEHARVVRVCELVDLAELRLRLRAVRSDEFLVLHNILCAQHPTLKLEQGKEMYRVDLLTRTLDLAHEPLLHEPDARDAIPA